MFPETVRLAQWAGLVCLGQMALDGTKMRANASKHKAMIHGRLVKTESELREGIAPLLAKAEAADRTEDEWHGVGRRGDELPVELRRRTDRLRRIEKARSALEAAARESQARALLEQQREDLRDGRGSRGASARGDAGAAGRGASGGVAGERRGGATVRGWIVRCRVAPAPGIGHAGRHADAAGAAQLHGPGQSDHEAGRELLAGL